MRARQQCLMFIATACLILCALSGTFAKDPQTRVAVTSPDGKNEIAVNLGEGGKGLFYTVARDGRPIVEKSPIDVRVASAGALSGSVAIERVDKQSVDKIGEVPWGKSRHIRDHFHEATVRLKSRQALEWQLELRAYDDGVAFRYRLQGEKPSHGAVIETENTEFRLAGDLTFSS